MEPYKIILVDDHSLFRNGLRGLLERCAACRVVGEAASGEEFLAMLGPSLLQQRARLQCFIDTMPA